MANGPTKNPKTPEEEQLDETIEESFPASDPPSSTPETGTGRPDEPKGAPGDETSRD